MLNGNCYLPTLSFSFGVNIIQLTPFPSLASWAERIHRVYYLCNMEHQAFSHIHMLDSPCYMFPNSTFLWTCMVITVGNVNSRGKLNVEISKYLCGGSPLAALVAFSSLFFVLIPISTNIQFCLDTKFEFATKAGCDMFKTSCLYLVHNFFSASFDLSRFD